MTDKMKQLEEAIDKLRKDIEEFQDLIAKPRIYISETDEKRAWAALSQAQRKP